VTVSKAECGVELYLNNVEGNNTIVEWDLANITAYNNVTGFTWYLEQNGTVIESGTGGALENLTYLTTEYYDYTAYWNGNANYTGCSQTYFMTVLQNATSKLDKILSQDWVLPKTNETIYVNVTLENNSTAMEIYQIEIIDEVPYDYSAPDNDSVNVYYVNLSGEYLVTSGYEVNVSNRDADNDIEVFINISNLSETNIGKNLAVTDEILVSYNMTTSEMNIDDTREMDTNSTTNSTEGVEYNDSINKTITAAHAFLKTDKKIFVDETNPLNATIIFTMTAVGGDLTDLLIADYLPVGASIDFRNVTYNNGTIIVLNESENDFDSTYLGSEVLPDSLSVDIYEYNFTTGQETNWEGTLYEGDVLTLYMNVSIIGGGSWTLPTIIGGFDPTYKKHISTEAHADLIVPLFDTILNLLTDAVNPGERLKALLTILNIGGPKARVDVAITYSAKSMEGDLITESTDTIAVTERAERELSLRIPEKTQPGMYAFEALVTYAGREAISTRSFEVLGVGIGLAIIIPLLIGIVIVVLVVLRLPKRYDQLELDAIRKRALRKKKNK
jgi:hypothetical protein